MAGKLPFLRSSLLLLSPEFDPFEDAREKLVTAALPQVPLSVFVFLYIFAAFHGIVIVLCLMTLLFLQFRRKNKSIWWVGRKLYITYDHEGETIAHPTPLFLPNSGLIGVIAQLMESSASIVYVVVTTVTFHGGHETLNTQRAIFLGVAWAFQFNAYWSLAWSLLISKLYTKASYTQKIKSRKRFYLLGPFYLNGFFTLYPIFVTVTIAIFTYSVAAVTKRELFLWENLVTLFEFASSLWQRNDSSEVEPTDKFSLAQEMFHTGRLAITKADELLQNTEVLWKRLRHFAVLWSLASVTTLPVYGVTLYQWTLTSPPNMKKSEECVVLNPQNTHSTDLLAQSSRGYRDRHQKKSGTSALLQKGVENLKIRCFLKVMAIFCTIGTSVNVVLSQDGHLTRPHWRDTTSWLWLASGAMSALATAFQCWRIYADQEWTATSSQRSNDPLRNSIDNVFAPIECLEIRIAPPKPSVPATPLDAGAQDMLWEEESQIAFMPSVGKVCADGFSSFMG